MGDFYNGGLFGISYFFVGSNWNFVSGYIKKRWHITWKFQLEKKQVIKKLSPKSLWQTYMKWAVGNSKTEVSKDLQLIIVTSLLDAVEIFTDAAWHCSMFCK